MNYYGYILESDMDEKEIYSFLRDALMQEFQEPIPARGPNLYINGTWRYSNEVDGELERFNGIEEIYKGSALVYRANFHGGAIN